MKKITFGTPEKLVPSLFCKNFNYNETPIKWDYTRISFKENARGCTLTFPLADNEHLYGLGLQLKSFQLNGRKFTLRVNADPVAATGDSHAPVPFFVSTAGYGIYIDSARYIEVYCGAKKAGQDSSKETVSKIAVSTDELYTTTQATEGAVMTIQIPAAKGISIYIFEGDTITDIVSQYNMLAGGGCDVPEWGLGVFYRAFAKYDEHQVMELADYFKNSNIPCSVIGLEPGWQSQTYSCSYVWDKNRFPDPESIIKKLRSMGYHINLWEHAFVHPSSPIYRDIKKYSGDYKVWNGCVPDFSLSEARKIFAEYHKNTIVQSGIDGFKLDECDSSDYTGGWSFPNLSEFPSGLDGEQYHCLFGTLYMQTVLEALDGNPTLSEVRNAGALSASYPFVLYSDLYDHHDFIRGFVNAGFSGLLWTPEVRHANSKADLLRRLQSVVFSPQCLINAWYCEQAPWIELGCEDEVRDLLKLRAELIPMLKEAFKVYKENGKPPIRALVSDFTDDPETYSIDDQYLFCSDLLVAPMTEQETSRKVYIPSGNWRDYFTKEPIFSGWHLIETSFIPVYEKY